MEKNDISPIDFAGFIGCSSGACKIVKIHDLTHAFCNILVVAPIIRTLLLLFASSYFQKSLQQLFTKKLFASFGRILEKRMGIF